MYKIKLTNDAQYNIKKLSFEGQNLKIEFTDKTCEELQIIFSSQANISTIRQYNTAGELITSSITGYTTLQGIYLSSDGVKTVMLGKTTDITQLNVSKASGDASMALTAATEAEKNTANALTAIELLQANLDYIAMETGVEL